MPKENPLAPYSILYELALLVPVHEMSAELADILDATNPLGGIQEGGAQVEFEVSERNRPIVGLGP